jgi:hypothetical protein
MGTVIKGDLLRLALEGRDEELHGEDHTLVMYEASS